MGAPHRTTVDGRLGWAPRPGESEDVQSLRSSVIFTLGNAGHDPDVLREARRLAQLHATGATLLHASMVDTALQLAAIEGDTELYDLYLARLAGSPNANSFSTWPRCPFSPTPD